MFISRNNSALSRINSWSSPGLFSRWGGLASKKKKKKCAWIFEKSRPLSSSSIREGKELFQYPPHSQLYYMFFFVLLPLTLFFKVGPPLHFYAAKRKKVLEKANRWELELARIYDSSGLIQTGSLFKTVSTYVLFLNLLTIFYILVKSERIQKFCRNLKRWE